MIKYPYCVTVTFLKFRNQIYVEILVGRLSLVLLAEDGDHVIVKSQSVCDSEVTHRPLVVLGHVDGLTRVLT